MRQPQDHAVTALNSALSLIFASFYEKVLKVL